MNYNMERGRVGNLIKLMKKLNGHKCGISISIITGIFKEIFTIFPAALCAYMVGLALKGMLLDKVKPLMILLCVCVILRALMSYAEMWFSHDVAYKILAELRIMLYDAVERVSPAILLNMRSGQLAVTLMSDVETLEWFFGHTAGTSLVAFIVTSGILIFMGNLHWVLPLIMLLFIAILLIIPFLMKSKADEQGKIVRNKLGEANSVTIEGLQGMKEILTLNYREEYKKKNCSYMEELSESQSDYAKRLGTEGGMLQICVGLAMLSITSISIFLVFNNKLPFEWFSVVVVLSVLAFNPVMELCGMARTFGMIVAAANRVFIVLESESLVEDKGIDIHNFTINKEIEFKNVSFRYGKHLPNALSNVSFKIRKGEMVALVGSSGAGKTTCTNLLMRQWDVNSGFIKIDGKDIREISLDTLGKLTSAVLQDVYLFNISIRENIRLGRLTATDEEVEKVAKEAFAHDFIMSFPEGYDMIAGERGVQISGGQRQRISIARALLRNSPILILDEAVSNLDTQSEREIQKVLKQVYSGRTTLVVAHRLSTIMAADRLVVMNEGKVVQVGTHDELVSQEGFYRDLISSQFTDISEVAIS